MPSLFIDAERLRDINSGLGQVCLRFGHELVRQCPKESNGELWTITFLVPKGQTGIFGPTVQYIEASWMRKFWLPGHYDVWHCLHQDSPYLPTQFQQRRTKLVLTIHDLNFLERPDYSEVKKKRRLNQLQRKVDKAAALATISHYTASIVREHLRIPPAISLQVIYQGGMLDPADVPAQLPKDSPVRSTIQPPYFLFLGAIHPKKNVHTLLPLLEAFPDYQLVVAGPDAHSYAQHIRDQAQKLGVADRLLMPGPVDELTKLWLYAQCEAFLFPSLAEGFGLPVVEAMSFGKPVFLSNLTSLPEVGGKEAYYFDSFEPERMAQTLHDGLVDFAQNPLREQRLRRRAAEYSWSNLAKEYWSLYRRLLQ